MITNGEAVVFVCNYINENDGKIKGAAQKLIEKALIYGSSDNISVTIIDLRSNPHAGMPSRFYVE